MSFNTLQIKGDKAFAFASFSDFHIGVRRNNPKTMREMLEKGLINNPFFKQIKLLTIAGDFFDRSLYLAEDAADEADRLICRIFRACENHGIVLRVLEGTPSHDAKQNSRFSTLFEIIKPNVDFKYYSEVDIEYIESLDINVLYVPDEAHPTTHKTKEVVQALLEAKGLNQVDIAVMHGFFEYQIPHGAKDGAFHDIEFYSNIVKYWVTIGHVHTRSRMRNILAQGSYDRVSHGEEGAKGYVIATVRNEGGDEAWFIDNPDAHTYVTLNCFAMEPEAIHVLLSEKLPSLREGSRVRIEADKDNPIFANMLELSQSWPHVHFSKLLRATEDDNEVEKMLDETLKSYASLKIDKETITPLLKERLETRGLAEDKLQRALGRLQECL